MKTPDRHTEVVPDVHFTDESADINDCLTEEIIGLLRQRFPHFRLDVIILVPDQQSDTVSATAA